MGKKLLKEMDRVVSAASASEARRPQQGTDDAHIMGGAFDAPSKFATQKCKFGHCSSERAFKHWLTCE
jgi:hypothetical protein